MAVTLIADDLTGACDAGALFTGRGRVRVIVDGASADPRREVVAIDTESRALPPAEARARVRAAVDRLATRLVGGLLFKKIDSTLRGPVGEEIEALQDAAGRRTALVCSAFPQQGRTVVDGELRVHGTPAHASAVGRDPGYPGATSDVAAILRRGVTRPVRHLPLDCVRRGGAQLVETVLMRGAGMVTADAETDADLMALAALAASPDLVLAGSAGLARAVATRLGHLGPPVPLPAGRGWLVVAGSLNAATRAQLSALAATGAAGVVIDPEREPDVQPLVAELSHGRPVFMTTHADGPPTPEARARVAAALGRAAARVLARRRPDLVAVTGGDIACALLGVLGAPRLEVVGWPSTGLALADLVVDDGPPISMLTKAGGFGPPDLLVTLLKGAA